MAAAAYRFGKFELRLGYLELRRDGVALKVEPRPLEVLAELLHSAGELVTKSELMDTVWAGRVVTESVVARCIKKLRDALDDESQQLIASVHGYGYRFTARVAVLEEAPDSAGAMPDVALPVAGDTPPLRPNWRLVQALDARGLVWLARHDKTGDQRVLKFGLSQEQVRALRHEITIHRLLARGLGERRDFARLLDYNLEAPPCFLETEYCPLGNLAEWCQAQGGVAQLPLGPRVELLAQLAGALAAAHSLGVLHMDIKPSNILVFLDGDGQPRLRWSDFGSGRLLQSGKLAELGITQLGSTATLAALNSPLQGSLNYIAPELLRGESPTIRSDLYAMGVLLYQVAAGDLRRPLTAGWESNISEALLCEDIAATAHDNPALRLNSADELRVRLATLAQRRSARVEQRRREAESALLRQRLERARTRRPWLMAAGAAVVLGIAVGIWNYRLALLARDQARAQAEIADAVIDFLDKDILSLGYPFSVNEHGPERLTVQDAVKRAAARLDGRFPGRPGVEAAIHAVIGQVYTALGEGGDAAEQQVRKAVQLGRSAAGGVDERTLRAEFGLAYAVALEQKFPQARALLDEANRDFERSPAVSLETRLKRDATTAGYHFVAQDYASAIPFLEQALADQLQHDPTDVAAVAIRQMYLARCYAAVRRFAEAERLFTQALAGVKRAEPRPGALTGVIEEQYGIGLFFAGRDRDAEAQLRVAHADLRAADGDDGLTTEALTYLGWVLLHAGQTAEANRALREAADEKEAYPSDDKHFTSLRTRACLGLAQIANGEQVAGLAELAAAVSDYDHELGPDAAEAQLFRFLLLEQRAALHQAPADIGSQLAKLSAERMSQAAPWEDWAARLARARSRFAAGVLARSG